MDRKRVFSPTVLFVVLAVAAAAGCGGGGGGGTEGETLSLGDITAYYPGNGSAWNDYVKNDGTTIFNASGSAATGTETGGYGSVIHGGEMRVVPVQGQSDCTGLTATDALGALTWVCDDSGGGPAFVSTGLADSAGLSDLIDFSVPGWKENSVNGYKDGVLFETSSSSVWWSNPVYEDNDGGSLGTAGAIYVVTTASPGNDYTLSDHRIAFLVQPGLTVQINGASECIQGGARDYLWVEGSIDATGSNNVLMLSTYSNGFSVVRNFSAVNGGGSGISMTSTSSNFLKNVTVKNNGRGIDIFNSGYNTISGAVAAGNSAEGIIIQNDSPGNRLSSIIADFNTRGLFLSAAPDTQVTDLFASGNTLSGLYATTGSDGGVFRRIRASNNSDGMAFYDTDRQTVSDAGLFNNNIGLTVNQSLDNVLMNVTLAGGLNGLRIENSSGNLVSNVVSNNQGYSVWLITSDNNTLQNITSNNSDRGLYLDRSSGNTIANAVLTHNMIGASIESTDGNRFTGLLKVGNNSTSDCWTADPDQGLEHGTCLNNGASDAVLSTNVSVANSFVGKVGTDDIVNLSDNNGAAAYNSILDWNRFENGHRGWGLDGSPFPSADHQGVADSSDTLRIWDWRLLTGDIGDNGAPALLDALSLPTAADTLIHAWAGTTTQTEFLRKSIEMMGDGLGNENTICEADENCLYTPNIAVYQGHEAIVYRGNVAIGAGSANLYAYTTNGL